MVSCARYGATDLCSILVPSDHRQRIVHLEALRNDDAIAEILDEAAAAKLLAADHARDLPMRRKQWRIAFAAALLLVIAFLASSWSQDGKAWRVIDGDTLDLEGERIRLFAVDAPERGPVACGKAATDTLADILSAGPVRCARVSTDRYGRAVAHYTAGRLDVNRKMVRRGMAWAYRQYGDDYVRDERAAKKARLGIWKYRSQPAWDYRAQNMAPRQGRG